MTIRVHFWLIRIALAVFLVQVASPAIAMNSPIVGCADMRHAKSHAVSDNRTQTAIQRTEDSAIEKGQCVERRHSVTGLQVNMPEHDGAMTHFGVCTACQFGCGSALGHQTPVVAPVAFETDTQNNVATPLSPGWVTRVPLPPPRGEANR